MVKSVQWLALWMLAVSVCIGAGIPQKMNYQGYLTTRSGSPINGTRTLTFKIYSVATGGSSQWAETQTDVPVTNGLFNVVLGSVSSLTAVSSAEWRGSLYLGVTVQGDVELAPRQLLVSVPYALGAARVDYDQVITVAASGGDATNLYQALQLVADLSPEPSVTTPYIIDIQAGVFRETTSLAVPSHVSLKGAGRTATRIQLENVPMTVGSECTVSDLGLYATGAAAKLSFASVTHSHVRNCGFELIDSYPYGFNFQNSSNCTFINNSVVHRGNGLYTLYIQTAIQFLMQGNSIDITPLTASSSTAVFANNIKQCVLRDNTIAHFGVANLSYGIQINNSSNTARIVNNVFMGELATASSHDIYNTTTATYPVRPSHSGPYGINNQGSSGSELPAF